MPQFIGKSLQVPACGNAYGGSFEPEQSLQAFSLRPQRGGR